MRLGSCYISTARRVPNPPGSFGEFSELTSSGSRSCISHTPLSCFTPFHVDLKFSCLTGFHNSTYSKHLGGFSISPEDFQSLTGSTSIPAPSSLSPLWHVKGGDHSSAAWQGGVWSTHFTNNLLLAKGRGTDLSQGVRMSAHPGIQDVTKSKLMPDSAGHASKSRSKEINFTRKANGPRRWQTQVLKPHLSSGLIASCFYAGEGEQARE